MDFSTSVRLHMSSCLQWLWGAGLPNCSQALGLSIFLLSVQLCAVVWSASPESFSYHKWCPKSPSLSLNSSVKTTKCIRFSLYTEDSKADVPYIEATALLFDVFLTVVCGGKYWKDLEKFMSTCSPSPEEAEVKESWMSLSPVWATL